MESLLFTNALQLALYASAPIIIAIVIAGVFSGLLQTVTQVNDESISFGIKVIATVVALFVFSNFIFAELQGFASYSWNIQANPIQ